MMEGGIQQDTLYIIIIILVILVFGDFVILYLEQVTIKKNIQSLTFLPGLEAKSTIRIRIKKLCDKYYIIDYVDHNLALLFGNLKPLAILSPYSGSHLVNTFTCLS